MNLKAGTNNDLNNSMADDMEKAFIAAWPSIMDGAPPPPSKELRLLFIAIAQGVTKHLNDNSDAFKIINNTGSTTIFSVDIKTTGTLY